MPMNWQQPRTGAFMPSGYSPRFSGGGTITPSGRGRPAYNATLHVGAAPSPRFSGGGNITASGRGRPSYHPHRVGAAPSPRFSGGGNITASGRGRPSYHPHRVGAAPSPRFSGGGTITPSGRGRPSYHPHRVGAAPSPRFSGDGNITVSGRGRPSCKATLRVVCRVVAQYFSTRERSLSRLLERRPRSLPLRPTTQTLLPLNGAGGEGDYGRAPVADACTGPIPRWPLSPPTGSST
jgi:hypothetical protein